MTHTFLERSEPVPVVWTCVIKERIKEIVNWTTSVGKLLLTTLSIWNTINLKNTREFLRSSRFRYRWSSISSIPHNLMWYIFANYGNSPQQDTWLWYLFLRAVNMHSNFCSTSVLILSKHRHLLLTSEALYSFDYIVFLSGCGYPFLWSFFVEKLKTFLKYDLCQRI